MCYIGFKQLWDRRRVDRTHLVSQGRVIIELTYGRLASGGKVHVTCPYNKDFERSAKELSGRWRSTSMMWSFPAVSQRLVVELCTRVYGKDAITLLNFPQSKAATK